MRITTYLQITEQDAQLLDKTLRQTPFGSRTNFLTACVRVFLYGQHHNTDKLPEPCIGNWLCDLKTEADLRTTLQTTYFRLLADLAVPAIAMKGSRTACRLLRKDLERGMLEQCGAVLSLREMETLTRIFEEIHMPELIRHRTRTLAEQYQEENP